MSFGLYLHFPFCRNKCSYCDFYKEIHSEDLERRFYRALIEETELAAEAYAAICGPVASIFIGGGTPTLTNRDLFADWLSHLKRLFEVPNGIEFSIENNPESVSLDVLQAYREFGITRPVFGIQSFNTKLLKVLGRKHRTRDSHRAIYHTNALGFKNFGVDLIFGLPGQSGKLLSADLDQLLDLEPPHISFYQLTVEEGTRLERMVGQGKVRIPDPVLQLAMYRSGVEKMTEAGYERYEVSSFARPGFECLHNIGYWEGQDYLGLGPSAHSFMMGQRYANAPSLADYLRDLGSGRRPTIIDESGIQERMTEAVMLGLRMARGISRSDFSQRFGVPLDDRLDREQYRTLLESGHLEADSDVLRLSDEGFYLADEITRRLLK